MSSHREAPETAQDPVADNTDTYAFVSPDAPDTVTLISNYIPFEEPAGGPNFYEFGEDVRYLIHVDNDGDGQPNVSYQFDFTTEVGNPATFLYNTGPDRVARQRQLEPQAVLHRLQGDQLRAEGLDLQGHRQARQLPTVQRRRPFDAQLRGPRHGGDPQPQGRRQSVRRPAQGGLLRRPRVDLRPGRAPAVPEPAPDPAGGGTRCQRHTGRQRPQHRRSGAAHRPDQRWGDADRSSTTRRPSSASGRRRTVASSGSRRTTTGSSRVRGSRSRGSATRCSTRSSTASASRTAWNTKGPAGDSVYADSVAHPPAGGPASGALPGRVPEPGRADGRPGRPARDPDDRDPVRADPGLPELHGQHPGRHAASQRGHPAGQGARASMGSWAATWPVSPTDEGSPTT